MLEERRRPIRTVLQLAQLRGEIGRDLDLDVALALVIGPFIMRRMIDRIEVTARVPRRRRRHRSRRCAPPRIGRPFPNHLWQDPRGDKGEAR